MSIEMFSEVERRAASALRNVGWDLESQVRVGGPLHIADDGRYGPMSVDLVLRYRGVPLAVVEVKSPLLGWNQVGLHFEKWARVLGLRFGIVTDGDTWAVLDRFSPAFRDRRHRQVPVFLTPSPTNHPPSPEDVLGRIGAVDVDWKRWEKAFDAPDDTPLRQPVPGLFGEAEVHPLPLFPDQGDVSGDSCSFDDSPDEPDVTSAPVDERITAA